MPKDTPVTPPEDNGVRGNAVSLGGFSEASDKAVSHLQSHPDLKSAAFLAGKIHDKTGEVLEIGVFVRRTGRNIARQKMGVGL